MHSESVTVLISVELYCEINASQQIELYIFLLSLTRARKQDKPYWVGATYFYRFIRLDQFA